MSNITEFLSRAHYIKVKLEKLSLEYEEYQQRAGSIPGPTYDKEVVDHTRNLEAPFVKWIYKALEVEEKINKLKAELPKVEGEIVDTIDKLTNIDYRLILIYRYLDWMSWDDIAYKMHYSNPTIRRWHRQAIEELKTRAGLSNDEQS